jgi:AcrR family transcriptional regulator
MNNSPTRYKRRPAAQRRELILDAAARLIAEHGYDHTTVDDIAREAGVSKGAVYLHWDGKESLFDDLLRTEMQRTIQDAFNRIFADPDGGLIGAILPPLTAGAAGKPAGLGAVHSPEPHPRRFHAAQDPARYTGRFLLRSTS